MASNDCPRVFRNINGVKEVRPEEQVFVVVQQESSQSSRPVA
jgi:hypothetical protein